MLPMIARIRIKTMVTRTNDITLGILIFSSISMIGEMIIAINIASKNGTITLFAALMPAKIITIDASEKRNV